jgi:hypothetical protein
MDRFSGIVGVLLVLALLLVGGLVAALYHLVAQFFS